MEVSCDDNLHTPQFDHAPNSGRVEMARTPVSHSMSRIQRPYAHDISNGPRESLQTSARTRSTLPGSLLTVLETSLCKSGISQHQYIDDDIYCSNALYYESYKRIPLAVAMFQ